jgi:formate-dependent nitrite reductase cytochrome c552 subunit
MPQLEMSKGVGGFGIKREMPSSKYIVKVPCTGCHMPDNKDHSFEIVMPKKVKEGKTDSCISCHTIFQPKIMQGQIDKWQSRTTKKLKEVKTLLDKKKEFKDDEWYQKAEMNYKFVKKDGSKGVHNPDYTFRLLKVAEDMLKSLKN